MMIIMYVAQLGKVYKVRSNDFKTSWESSASTEGVCSSCTSGLAAGFHQLKQQGFVLKKKNLKITTSKKPKLPTYYRDINAQNEWLWGNIDGKLYVLPCMYQEDSQKLVHNGLHDNKM